MSLIVNIAFIQSSSIDWQFIYFYRRIVYFYPDKLLVSIYINFISGQTENMPFILSVGTAFSEGANFSNSQTSIENENLECNQSSNNANGNESENSSTIYNI